MESQSINNKDVHRTTEIQEGQYIFPYHYISLYDRFYGTHAHKHYLSLLEFVISQVEILPTDSVLDVGCGDGRFAYEIDSIGARVTGVDRSTRAIAFAKAFAPNATFHAGDITDLPPEQFDKVYCIEVLEHIPQDAIGQFAADISACVKPNGYLVISVPSVAMPVHRKHFRHFTERDLRALFTRNLDVVVVRGHIVASSWRQWMRLVALARMLAAVPRGQIVFSKVNEWIGRYFERIQKASTDDCVNLVTVLRRRNSPG